MSTVSFHIALLRIAIPLFAALLTGCGGGGSGGNDTVTLTVGFNYSGTGQTNLFATPDSQPQISGMQGHTPNCAVTSGQLPPGITMNSDCTVSGKAAAVGSYSAVVTLTSPGVSGSVTSTLGIFVNAPAIHANVNGNTGGALFLTADLPITPVQMYNTQNYTQSTGMTAQFAVTSGTLPTGLNMDPQTSILSGTPTSVGTSTISVAMTVTDGQNSYTTLPVPININSALQNYVLNYTNCCTVNVGVPMQTVAPTTTYTPISGVVVTYALFDSDVLPAGVTLDASTGALSGTPTTAGIYYESTTMNIGLPSGSDQITSNNFTLLVLGIAPEYLVTSTGVNASYFAGNYPANYPYWINYNLSGNAPATVSPGTIYNGLAGDTYSYALTCDPTTPQTCVTAPAWITINASTGVISINPPANTTSSLTFGVQVTTQRGGVSYQFVQFWGINFS